MRYFHRPAENQKNVRWYTLHLQPDLFGGYDVICRWGRVGRKTVSERLERFSSAQHAKLRLNSLSALQIESGFVEVDKHPEESLQRPGHQLKLAWAGAQ
jgi:predicted DNA-binding WGR domain protein